MITQKGREELSQAHVSEKVGFVISRIETFSYLTNLDLEKNGYDQIPTGSYHADNEKNIGNTVKFCAENISDSLLMGFLQTLWKPTIEEYRKRIIKGIELAGKAKKFYYKIRE